MSKKVLTALAVLSSLVFAGTVAVAQQQVAGGAPQNVQNLIINGSFEEGPDPGDFVNVKAGETTIYGWEVRRDNVDWVGTHFPSAHGKKHVDLNGAQAHGVIQQTFRTIPGHKYRLSFDMAGNSDGGPEVKKVGVGVAGLHNTYTHGANTNWLNYTMTFYAQGETSTLEFVSLDKDAEGHFGALIDKISVVDITPPPMVSFTGRWKTNWGDMELRVVNGNQIEGNYTHDQGKIRGQLSADGRTMTGFWTESPSYQPPNDGGKVTFTLSEDGRQMTGKWSYGEADPSQSWTGTRIGQQ